MTKQIIKHHCGCITEETREKKEDLLYTSTKEIKMCNTCKRIRKERQNLEIKQEKEKKEFEKFPNKKSKKIFTLLNNMIDKLYDDGVDISYFPSEANKTLKKYAIKIEKLK